MVFEGWVPNATGNLSFSAIGNSLSGGIKLRQNFWCDDNRWAICAQERRNRDRQIPSALLSILPESLGPPRTNRLHRLVYVLTCRSVPAGPDVEGALTGQIAILLPIYEKGAAALEIARSTEAQLTVARDAHRVGADFTKPTDQSWAQCQNDIRHNSLFACTFTLLRNGKCFINSGVTDLINPTILQWLASQCYFFLKDSIHQHYHHRSSTDAIIEVTAQGSTPDWRLRTLRNLYRKVLQMRRYFSGDGLSDALGVLSYARAFRELFGTADFTEAGVKLGATPLPEYSKEVGDSITIRRDAARRAYDQRKTDSQFLVASSVAVVALFVALYDEFDDKSQAHKIGITLVNALGSHPIFMVIPIIIVGTAVRLYTGQFDTAKLVPVRWVYRLLAWIRKETLVFILLLAAIANAVWAISLFKQALFH